MAAKLVAITFYGITSTSMTTARAGSKSSSVRTDTRPLGACGELQREEKENLLVYLRVVQQMCPHSGNCMFTLFSRGEVNGSCGSVLLRTMLLEKLSRVVVVVSALVTVHGIYIIWLRTSIYVCLARASIGMYSSILKT